eukprot:TRINITY_DN9320_c0_g1_i1.p1 TRINITY_DN9320_c0_g1~~TRINITY_DN9320_c0_g1_i1.p1  ORF type:complete len:683 (-),score=164.86 TRINITY_DN9320_c0_g1_i1:23-2071(-)
MLALTKGTSASALSGSADVMAGIFVPPPEVKNIIDKTAEFVARNGANFEAKIKKHEVDNPRFAFLKVGNPHYAYYQQKVRDIRIAEGIPDPAVEKSIKDVAMEKLKLKKRLLGEEDPTAENGEALSNNPKLQDAKQKLTFEQNLEPPPPEEWVIEAPKISALDLDIMKLVAQFVARNGRPFQMGLVSRELKNPQFNFLQPMHPFHSYFQRLVESYTKVLLPPRDIVQTLKHNAEDKRGTIDRMMKRVNWERVQIRSQKELEAEQEREREAMAMIDWHDFVVVETITFDEESLGNTTAGTTASVTQPESKVVDMDMDTEDAEMEIETKGEPDRPLPIRTEYTRRTRPLSDQRSVKYQVCPKCGQEIRVDEMEEHMKIELSNPEVVRRQISSKAQESSLARDSEVAENLVDLAGKRTDIFGEEEVELGRQVGASDEDEKKKLQKVTWDGHTSSIQRTAQEALGGMSLKDQIASIHASKGLTKGNEQQPAIGPIALNQPRVPMPFQTPMPFGLPGFPLPPPMGMSFPPFPAGPHPMPGFMMGQPPGLGQTGLGPIPHPRPMPTPGYEPPNKKLKTDTSSKELVPEAEWKATFPGPIRLLINIPRIEDKPEWKLNGQILEVKLDIDAQIKDLKKELQNQLGGMPPNKQKIKADVGFFKDNFSLAYYNLKDGTMLQLGVKERGGRKK